MTQRELENIIPLRNEIKELKDSIRAAPTAQGTVSGSDHQHPFLIHHEAVMGFDDDVLMDKERLKKYQAEYDRLIAYIDSIEDSLMHQILRYRYVKGLSFQQIAFRTGYQDEGSPRKKVKDFFEDSEISEKHAV